MPLFEIQVDGRTFELDAPDRAAALAALGGIARPKTAGGRMTAGDIGMDMAKSGGIGLAEGAIDLAGMPGNIRQGYSAATDYIGNKLGFRPDQIEQFKTAAQRVGQTIPMVNAVASGPNSDVIKKRVEEQTGEFYKPQTTAGEYARTVGNTAAGAVVGPGSIPMRAATTAGSALASESAGQYLKGKPTEGIARIVAALAGGVAGGVPVAVHEARRSLIPGMSGPTSRVLERAVTPDAERRLAELGPDAMLLDAGPATRQFAQGVANRPGEGSAYLTDAVTRRNQGTNARLQADMDSALGPATAPSAINRNIDEQIANLQPLYQQVTQLNEPVHLQHVWDRLRANIPQESGETQRVLRQIEDMIAPVYREEGSRGVTGQRMLRTHPREVLNVRQELDQLHGRLGESPKAQRAVAEARQLVDEALGEAVPDLKIVDQSYANLMREREALTRGSQIFDTGKEAIRPEDLIRGRQAQPLPIREAERHGARAELDRRIGIQSNDLQALRNSVMSEGDWNPAKMAEVFGARETERIMRSIDREAAFRDAYNKVTQNSQTAPRQEATRMLNLETPQAPDVRGTTLTGLALAAGKKGIDVFRNQRDAIRSEQTSRELARSFTTSGDERDALVRAIRNAQNRRGKTNATRDVLVRALMNAQAGSIRSRD
jgi:hypothetical protein